MLSLDVFRSGEQLDIIDHPADDPEWWTARNSVGHSGLVPRNYIKVSCQELFFDIESASLGKKIEMSNMIIFFSLALILYLLTNF